jgi:hypothetical protein
MADELAAMIRKLRAVPGIAERAAPDVADAVRADLERTIAAGTSATGEPWAPRKEDGGRPLAGASKALAVVAVGTRVYARIAGHIGRHHLGRARGGVYRRILPTKGMPPRMSLAVRRALAEHFRRTIREA